ncbi:hypothetical protein MRB53_038010 [Persea americana]|nr:hypothetical protein MRB53_038010 [Persea americana]
MAPLHTSSKNIYRFVNWLVSCIYVRAAVLSALLRARSAFVTAANMAFQDEKALYEKGTYTNPINDLPPIAVDHATAMAGTHHDHGDMSRIGRAQNFRRNFHFLPTLGFICITMVTWEGVLYTNSYSLIDGGLAGWVWSYVIAISAFTFAVLSMAEMASIAPTSAGQYAWV